jgi:hypothetical protein
MATRAAAIIFFIMSLPFICAYLRRDATGRQQATVAYTLRVFTKPVNDAANNLCWRRGQSLIELVR